MDRNEEQLTPEQAAEAKANFIITDMAQRVHTVMCNYAEVLARKTPGGVVDGPDSMALLNGAISGIAVMVARMAIQRNPDAPPEDTRTPEEFYADHLKTQFLFTYRSVQEQDAAIALAEGAPVS